MRGDFALYLVGVVEFDIQREAGYSPCVKAVAQPSCGIYVLVGDISGELVRNDYRRVLVQHGGSDEDPGVSHFYINRMSYSFRNDGAFCLQKIFLKR